MHWVDRIRQVKLLLIGMAVVIAVVTLAVSQYLVRDLAQEEEGNMEVWAEAMRSLNNADENTDLSLVLRVIEGNNYIPVAVIGPKGEVRDFRNVKLDEATLVDSLRTVGRLAAHWRSEGQVIRIDNTEVCYDESLMLKRLRIYPYVSLGVVLIFVVVAIFALLTSKRAEQNKVWVGLSKETAHQLGTPISSLMAWVEIMKETYPDDTLIPEMDKDVKRLQMIAERFSKIGSLPEPQDADMVAILGHVVEYITRRASNKVQITCQFPPHPVMVKCNASLFEWVIENLCKNAIDAMNGQGQIAICLTEEGTRVVIDVTDTGKGILKKHFKSVFTPGFTTKKRGWGLGLSLAKRIVEEYHKGKIYVKNSELGVGTTFCVELKK